MGLNWDRVNLEQWIISIFDTKNHERRDIPMDETVRRTLQGIERKGEFVFVGGGGKPVRAGITHPPFIEH